jgi:hypothetical protein
MYEVKVDEQAHLVEIIFGGAMTDQGLDGFDHALRSGALRAKGGGSYFDMLNDFSPSTLMPHEIAADGAARTAWCVAHGLRKAANIASGMLMKLQLDQVSGSGKVRTFLTREEALAWLAEDDPLA